MHIFYVYNVQPTINHRCENCHAFKVWVSYSFVQDEPTNAVKKGQAKKVDQSLPQGNCYGVKTAHRGELLLPPHCQCWNIPYSRYLLLLHLFLLIDSLAFFVHGIRRSGTSP